MTPTHPFRILQWNYADLLLRIMIFCSNQLDLVPLVTIFRSQIHRETHPYPCGNIVRGGSL